MPTLRWGLIGCGDVARRRVAQAILEHPHCELVAACRRNEAALEKFCEDYGVPHAFTDADALIADASLDAVYIATPVGCHREQAVKAAQAGRHVLLEKPMALNVAECDAIAQAASDAKVTLGIAYYRRFYPIVARMKELVDNGAIGTPLSIRAATATRALTPDFEGYWRVDPEQSGGGPLMDLGSHRLDLFRTFFGDPTQAHAICATRCGDYATEDCASALFRFPDGVHGSLECFFGAGADPDEFSILGTKGRLDATPLNRGELRIETDGQRRHESHPPHQNYNVPLVEDFVAAIEQHKSPTVSGPDGRAVNAAVALAYQAARD
jgi:predicted dehydrogenase